MNIDACIQQALANADMRMLERLLMPRQVLQEQACCCTNNESSAQASHRVLVEVVVCATSQRVETHQVFKGADLPSAQQRNMSREECTVRRAVCSCSTT